MCGIVGALTFDAFEKKTEEKVRTEASIFITTQLLQATVERGKDATGISLLWADGNYTGLKMGIPAPEFIARFGDTENDFEGFLKLWRNYPKLMKVFIGHCRKSSIGNSYDNKNNHPIQIGDIIMLHNGTLTNHETIFDKLNCDRLGDVDSEAIGRLLHHYTSGGVEPFTLDMLVETTRRLHGTYSVLAMSGNNPYQVAQFRDGRPAEMVLVKPLKMVFIASEKKFLENVLFEYNKMSKLFAIATKFPYLKQSDVEFKILPDDTAALWDLTIPVTTETKIEDLYDSEKTPLRVDKLWSNITTTTYNKSNVNTPANKTTSTEVNAKGKKNGSGDNAEVDADGLVWSKALNKYKGQDGIKTTKEYGAVIIDVEKGSVTAAGKELNVVNLKAVDKDVVENLITGAAEIKELSLKRTDDAAKSLATEGKKNSGESGDNVEDKTAGTTIEVDMTSDPEALKKAEEIVENGLTKYETDDEVAADVEASDTSILRPLPIYALANRIKKFIFKQGWYTGYVARKAEEKQPDTVGVLTDQKKENAEKKIRIMKAVIKIMASALERRCRGNTPYAVQLMVEAAVSEAYKPADGVTVDLSLAFSVGDLKNIPLLKEIDEQMQKK